jgi:hypothetical protein
MFRKMTAAGASAAVALVAVAPGGAASSQWFTGKTARGDKANVRMAGDRVTDGLVWVRERCLTTGGRYKTGRPRPWPVVKVRLVNGRASAHRVGGFKNPPERQDTWFTLRRVADGRMTGTIRTRTTGSITCHAPKTAFSVTLLAPTPAPEPAPESTPERR